jgi:molybdenum cofactor synthesis domain-containing protein
MIAAILTISDRCSAGNAVDASGPALADICHRQLGAQIFATAVVPDDVQAIREQLRNWAKVTPPIDLILTTGGTGLAPRDLTPEATGGILERRFPALLELARTRCLAKTPRAYLSRGECGTLGRSLIINLPGSPRGAAEFLEALLDVLPHAVQMLRGENLDHGSAAQVKPSENA